MFELDAHYGQSEPIAVIGLAGRFPQASDIAQFWQNLIDARVCSERLSPEALRTAGIDAATAQAPNFVNIGAMLDDAEGFDAGLFGYSSQEAELIDPQQRLFLQGVWHVLEHAGYAPRAVPHKTGVFGTARISTYPARDQLRIADVAQARGMQILMGNDKDYLATRAAYKLDLRGPALTVQTACSSSLVAVHMACESLRAGECDMAVAGGVGVSFPQQSGYRHQPGMIFSADGACRPFDAAADGTFPGNGLGLVALRHLSDALRDGDPVIAVIRGSAINNDGGGKAGFTAPTVAGQCEVIREAMLLADVDADAIGMIEAHGTGTPLGDPIEMEALRQAFAERSPSAPACVVSSVKGNIGHLDTAAGVAGLIKAILAVQHAILPATAHYRQPNPALKLEQSPFRISAHSEPWAAPSRTAGVSSFGIGGTNCHVVVQSLPPERRGRDAPSETPAGSLLLSAASPAALRRLAGAWAERFRSDARPDDLAFTALHGRQLNLDHRLTTPLTPETADALAAFAAGGDDLLIHHGHRGGLGKTAWVFTGLGSQWPSMANDLYACSPAFAQMLDRCFDACAGRIAPDLRQVMFGDDAARLEQMDYAPAAIVAFELALAAHWQALGLQPDIVLGHSLGEYAASVVAGYFHVEQILPLALDSGALLQRSAPGGMVLVLAAEEDIAEQAATHGVDIAAYNGPGHLLYSGPAEAIDAFARELKSQRIRCRRIATRRAAHSRVLAPLLHGFSDRAGLTADDARLTMLSSVLGREIEKADLDRTDYWVRHLREPVCYRQAAQQLAQRGVTVALEIGPDATLSDIGARESDSPVRWIACARREQPMQDTLEQAAAQLFACGHDLPWTQMFALAGRRCQAPLYPFDSKRHWYRAPAVRARQESPPTFVTTHSLEATTSTATASDPLLASGLQVARERMAQLDLGRIEAFYRCAARLSAVYVDALVQRCLGDVGDAGFDTLSVLRSGRLLPRYRQLLERLLNACAEDGFYQRRGDRFHRVQPVPQEQKPALLDELREHCEGLDVVVDTADRAGSQLYAMLSGEVEAVAVVFPGGQSDGVETLYQEFSIGRYFNEIAGGVVAGLRRQHVDAAGNERPLRILEVGGGTGGTTASLLPALAGHRDLRYDFTDITALFTRRAQRKFADVDFIDYRELDLEKPAQAQGFKPGEYDLIVAANVIHATGHIGETLTNLRGLLKPGGHLLMREITTPVRLFDPLFGALVLPIRDQPERHGQLFLSPGDWRRQCLAAGFESLHSLPDDSSPAACLYERILLARQPAPAHSADIPFGHDARIRAIAQETEQDWSDAAADTAQFRQRLSALCENGLPEEYEPPMPPPWLTRVRWRHCDGLFGARRIEIEAMSPQGNWQPLLTFDPARPQRRDPALPIPEAAPDTLYDWRWDRIDLSPDLPIARLHDPDTLPAPYRARLDECRTAATPNAAVLRFAAPEADAPALAAGIIRQLREDRAHDLIVVTRQAWRLPGEHTADPTQRSLWGLMRVAATEFPERGLAVIDLDADAAPADLEKGLAAVAASQCWVAVRHGEAFAPRLIRRAHRDRVMPVTALSGDRWHVVTGGFGGLGRLCLHWLADAGARRLAVLAPHDAADREALSAALRQRYGAEVRWLPCDCGDAEPFERCLQALHDEGGIDGVVHAAGVLDDAPLLNLDDARIGRVFAVKAGAAQRLRDRLSILQARYLLLFSSAASALGSHGQAAHALACGYLDGMAEASAGGSALHVMTIAWGAWGETGRASTAEVREPLAARGMLTLRNAEGLWHLQQAMLAPPGYRLAMRVEPRLTATASSPVIEEAATATAPPPSTDAPIPASATGIGAGVGTDPERTRAWLTALVRDHLRLKPGTEIAPDQSLLQLGLDSLLFLELRSEIESLLKLQLNAGSAYDDMTIDGLSALILEHAPDDATPTPALRREWVHDAEHRHAPFPLTPIQHAYWLGRTDLIGYGGVACHALFEWDLSTDFDLDRLQRAWNRLIERHDMLRMVIGNDGQQRILPHTPEYRFPRTDLSGLDADERETQLQQIRREMEYRVLPADQWPLFEVNVSILDARHYRLHLNLDLLQFDTQSFKIMMDDLSRAYADEPMPPLEATFRDYVMAEQAERESAQWQTAWCYWQDRLPRLPPAPALPMADGMPAGQPRFTTYQHRIGGGAWSRLKQCCRQWGVTPSTVLLSLFARLLERWSRHPAFTLNLTFFNRKPFHSQVQQLIGDFTSVLLVDFDIDESQSLHDTIQATQAQLWRHLAHAQVNGVELMRELGRYQSSGLPQMPVVFTSMLGMTLDGMAIDQALGSFFGDPIYMFTQTPQVWLDHQVMEAEGELICNWFCMDEAFAAGTADAMFADYAAALDAVAANPECLFSPGLPAAGRDGTPAPLPHRRGDDGFAGWERLLRDHPAVRAAQVDQVEQETVVTVVADDDHAPGDGGAPLTLELAAPEAATLADADASWHHLESRALAGICRTLVRHALFADTGKRATLDEVQRRLNAQSGFRRLLSQWLDYLATRGLLEKDGDAYRAPMPLSRHSEPAAAPPSARWFHVLGEYLDRCIDAHDALFEGRRSALELLFGDDGEIARQLYEEHPVMRSLHQRAAEIAQALARREGPLAVLEVGSGTGATTRALRPALEGALRRYVFSDVSPLFLNQARREFGDAAPMAYQLLDINQPIDFSRHPPHGYDLIVAVNVLHDASHIVHSLKRLGRLLKPGGHLLMIEATERDSAMQLASVGFIEGLSAYQDFRIGENKAMLTLPMWREALTQAGFALDTHWPQVEASPLRQHLLLARAQGIGRLDTEALQRHLSARVPEPLPDLRWEQRERLSPAALSVTASAPAVESVETVPIPSYPAIEAEVAALWSSLLSRAVTRDTDFFASGGDSLIATRMVSQLARQGFSGASLQRLFAHPVLGAFCAGLSPRAENRTASAVLLADDGGGEITFVAHASDGDPSACLPLAQALRGQVFGLPALDLAALADMPALLRRHLQALRDVQPRGPYTLIGWSYGAFVVTGMAQALQQQNESARVVLIDPVCRDDFRIGAHSGLTPLLANAPLELTPPDGFGGWPQSQQRSWLLQQAHRARMIAHPPESAQASEWLARIEGLLRLLDSPPIAAIGCPCLCLTAANRPAHWSPPEREWHDWLRTAECHPIEADHWQLARDPFHAGRCAGLIEAWRARLPQSHSTLEVSA